MAKAVPTRAVAAHGAAGGERDALALLAITALAALLRLLHFGHSPPGLNQDEAVNAWNAWCLLKTGHDMTGAPWPVFYSHAIGDNRTTLMFYAMMPFQALGGLGAATARLPAAVSGILCVPLVWYVAKRLFGRAAGLAAALLLAVDPWHVFMSRWGIDGAICPFLALLPLALLAASGLLDAEGEARPRPGLAALAGIAAGVACYGYWPMRLYIPATLALLALFGGRALARSIAARGGWRAVLALAAGFAATFGPLAWRHLTDPAISRRAEMTRLWESGAPLPEIARLVFARWLEHYGPAFLFVRGDTYSLLAPAEGGALHRFMLPLLVLGLGFALAAARRSVPARLLLALVAAYPAGDVLARYDGVHALRSSPGIAALSLLAAYGAVRAGAALARRSAALARVAIALFALLAGFGVASWSAAYFGEYDGRPTIYHGFHADLLEASGWIRPRLAATDAVFCTAQGMNEPFSVLLVGLGWEPARWFAEPRDTVVANGWDVYTRVGKMRFLYGDTWRGELEALEKNGKADRVLFVVRPGELGLDHPAHVIRRPDGAEVLWIVERSL